MRLLNLNAEAIGRLIAVGPELSPEHIEREMNRSEQISKVAIEAIYEKKQKRIDVLSAICHIGKKSSGVNGVRTAPDAVPKAEAKRARRQEKRLRDIGAA